MTAAESAEDSLNEVVVTGKLKLRDGRPITYTEEACSDAVAVVLDLEFRRKGRDGQSNMGTVEVETTRDVVNTFGRPLTPGLSVLVSGELNGRGGIMARFIEAGPPYDIHDLSDDVSRTLERWSASRARARRVQEGD